MEPNAPLDYALFQLSPRRSRCELVVSGGGRTEKIASGSVKPFVTHLRAAEEQAAAQPPQPAIRLQLERRAAWFSKGTLERFVRFVSTPEVLELANGFEAEMSQLEGARKIYAAQGGASSGGDAEASAAADITKKELLRAIDVRLSALKQDLVTSCARASSAGFNHDSVSELLLFADHFGANRLSEACNKYMSLCQRRPDINPQHASQAVSSHWKSFEDGNLRDSCSSDMSIDEPQADHGESSNKSISGASVLHIDRLSNSQQSVDVPPGSSTEHNSKSTIQQAVDKQEKETDAPPAPSKELSRRLSVQDRISMFENKQKEQTSTSGNSNSAGTAKVVPVKGEHRRVPSVASMDKLVRRWSSVSDMSIDLSQNDNGGFNDKSENGTPAGTPTSANQEANSSKVRADKDASLAKHPVTSQSWSSQKDGDTPKDPITTNSCSSTFNTASPSSLSAVVTESPKKQTKSCSADDMAITSSTESEASFDKELGVNKMQGNVRISEHVASNVSTRTQLETSLRTAEEALPKYYDTLTTPLSEEHAQMTDKETTSVAHEVPVTSEQVGQKGNRGSRLRSKEMHAEAVASGRNDRSSRTVGKVSSGVDPKSKATSTPRTNFRGSSGRDGAPSAETEGHDASLRRKSLPRKVEDTRRKVAVSSEMLPPPDYSGRQGTNLSRQSSNAEQELNLLGGKVKSVNDGNAVPLEQTRVARPAKGNQDRHDELQMKANELEKLFAAHKLTTTRRGKSMDAQVDDTPRVSEPRPTKVLPEKTYTKQTVMDSMTNNFDATELLKMVDNEGYNNNSTPDKHDMLSLEESRGKFYDQYSQKRDAKLKEDWKLQKEEKEAMLKAMHESLERSKAEMRAKFSQSVDLLDSTYVSRSVQKIPPLQSVIRNKDQGVDSFLVEDEMNSDYLSGDGSSRSADSRKHFSNRVAYTPKISIAPVHNHKHSSRTVRPSYPNRRNPLENSLAQSVPSLSDLRKENTKPGHSRVTARAQPKSFSRSKSIIEESKSIMNEDQSRGSQSMRKNLNASELRDTSSVNKDIYNWAPSRTTSSTHKSGAPKSFLRKANGAHPIVGITGFRAPMFANVNDDDDDFPDQQEDSPDDAKNEGYESIEENLRESDFPADSESETPKLSHDFGNSDDPGSENGDVSFPGEAASTKFNSFAGNMHALPGELPAPWSSRLPHLLPYTNDTSDGDAFVDSPTGSPSPWNSHSLDQITDADVSRMRKKWGSAQMPFSGANASQQPRKDVTKGFKKLLKFGRKNRGADGLVNDWVSASTASECDDDLEDGRDLAIGSSDDFRKSRMGYPSSYDGFVENEVFTEQEPSLRSSIPNPPANFRLREDLLTGSSSIKAPRSFFSLPTFRSKGGDARLR